MAKFGNSKSGSGELSTIIGADTSIEGKLESKNAMRVDGNIKGEVISGESITIGSGGTINGDIIARDVVVGGKINGTITASGKIVLEESAVLNGDLKAVRLVVEEGATFNGNSEMGEQKTKSVFQPQKINLDEK